MRKYGLILALILLPIFSLQFLMHKDTYSSEGVNQRSITLYTSMNLKDITPIVESFERKTGVRVNIWKADSMKVVTRSLEEFKVGKLQADVIILRASRISYLAKENLFISYDGKDSHSIYRHLHTLAYNTNEISDPPRTYQALLESEYLNKMAIEIDSTEWEIGIQDALGQQYYQELLKKQQAHIIRSVDGYSLLTELVISGEVPIAVNLPNSYIEKAKEKGAPVDWVPLEPVIVAEEKAILVSDKKEAKEVIDFLISGECQHIILKNLCKAPADRSIKSPLDTGFSTFIPDIP